MINTTTIIAWCVGALVLLLIARSRWQGACISAAGAALLIATAVAFFPELTWQAQLAFFSLMTAIGLWLYTLVARDARASEVLLTREKRAEALRSQAVTIVGVVEGTPPRVQIEDQFWTLADSSAASWKPCPGDTATVVDIVDGELHLQPVSANGTNSAA